METLKATLLKKIEDHRPRTTRFAGDNLDIAYGSSLVKRC